MNIFGNHWVIIFACYALSGGGFAADVLTYHNDNAQTGLNPQEGTLAPQNVNANSFDLIRNLPVDGAVFAETLCVSNTQVISGGQFRGFHNLVISSAWINSAAISQEWQIRALPKVTPRRTPIGPELTA
jgi:hypothetical protein